MNLIELLRLACCGGLLIMAGWVVLLIASLRVAGEADDRAERAEWR